MGRMVFGLCLGFALVAGAIYWARTCLPDPNERGIEWLRREDVVVVQMKHQGGGWLFSGFAPPEFTLYGDGTLIYATYDDGEDEWRLFETALSRSEVASLLEMFVDRSFFTFDYEQPGGRITDASTKYLYASTREAANAVSAYALGADVVEHETGDLRDVLALSLKLDEVVEDKASEARPYLPDEGVLNIERISSSDPIASTPWPFDIDITTDEQRASQMLTQEQLVSLGLEDPSSTRTWLLAEQDGEVYHVQYRPALPYEEHFPEFDPPAP